MLIVTRKARPMSEPLPYEHAAMHGEPMPDNITSEADQLCYIALTLLYRMFRAKLVDRDEGKRIKAQLLYVLDKAKRMDEFNTKHCHAINRTFTACERHVNRYRHDREPFRQNPTPDNAARLVAVMDGIIETLYPTIPGSVELEEIPDGE